MSAMVWLLLGCQGSWTLSDVDGDGFTWLQGDCDDNDAAVFPNAVEECDGVDNNCSGDEGDSPQAQEWYVDTDGDGYGAGEVVLDCTAPPGGVATGDDCDDTTGGIFPGATEYCDGVDNNCDGEVDEDGAIGGVTFYTDADGDGYGDPDAPVAQCEQDGTVTNDSDCDDTLDEVNPDAAEVCDDIDNDCDGDIDDDDDSLDESSTRDFYVDADGDTYGAEGESFVACSTPDGYAANSRDCDDDDDTIYPGSDTLEIPYDGIDVDCDGLDVCTDLTCDGRPDVVLPSYVDDNGGYDLGSYAYLSTDLTSSIDIKTHGVLAGDNHDLNKDGYRDVVLATHFNGTSCEDDSKIYWGEADSPLSTTSTLATNGARDVVIADFDSDGWRDIIFSGATEGCEKGQSASPALIYWNENGSFSEESEQRSGTQNVWAIDVDDIDDDGEKDLLLCRHLNNDSYSATSVILWGDGRSFDGFTELATIGCADQLLEDLDGDGLLDVVFANYRDDDGSSPSSYVYFNDDDRFSTASVETLSISGAWSVLGEDLDNDDDVDLVFGAMGTDGAWEQDTVVFINDGAGGFDESIPLPANGSPYPAVADLDGDRRLDIVVPGYRTDAITPSEGTVATYIYWGADYYSIKDRTALESAGAWRAALSDFDEDGNTDVLLSGYYDGATYSADSRVYWGSSVGFSEESTTDLAVGGGIYAAPVVVGR